MADIFNEVDEELRHERYAKLWQKYGVYLVGVVVAVIVAVGALVGLREYREAQRAADSAAYQTALGQLESGDLTAATAGFERVAAEAGGGYPVLARLKQAEAHLRAGETEQAIAIYEAVGADDGAPAAFRDLATILSAFVRVDFADPGVLTERLSPLAVDGGPWRFSARELLAVLALRTGDRDRASELLTGLADDPDAPAGIRRRATETLAALET